MKENELEELEKERKVIEPILYLIKLLRGDEGLPSDIIFRKSEAWADDLKDLLCLYEQEKEKNKKLQIRGKELIEEKQELNTALLYDNISKDKIREYRKQFIKDNKKEKTFMTQSSQINASLIKFCEALLLE